MKIFIGADHGGFEMKAALVSWLIEAGHQVEDCGADTFNQEDDYPQFAWKVTEKVVADPDSMGILLCRFGGGMTIAANKVKGARAVMAQSVVAVEKARDDNNASVLVISGDLTPLTEAKELVTAFLNTPFSEAERHRRRLQQIEMYEDKS